MKRLGFFCPPTHKATSHTDGSFVAERGLAHALIEHSHFDAIDFVSGDPIETVLDDALRAFFKTHQERVSFQHHDAFTIHLPSREYHAFFQSGPYLNRLASVRDALGYRCFPVTTLLHSVAGEMFWDPYSPLYTYPFQACDAFFCSTQPLADVMSAAQAQAQTHLEAVHAGINVAPVRKECVPLGVEDPGVIAPSECVDARKRWGIGEEDLCFLYVGRLDVVAKMDVLPLLTVFRDCRALPSFKNAKLILAGATREEEKWVAFLEGQAEAFGVGDCVRVVPNFDEKMRRSLYALADVFVSMVDSIQESFGLAPVEAMLCGLPVVLSDWDGYKALVTHDETGLLVPTYWADCNPLSNVIHEEGMLHGMLSLAQSVAVDPRVLRDTLVHIAEDAALRDRLGKAARASALERFTWKPVVARYEAIWDELNAIAKTLPWPPKVQRLPRMSVFENFKHYPTRLVDRKTQFKTTVRGQRMGSGGEILALYPGVKVWVDVHLVGRLITLCLEGTSARRLASEVGLPIERVLYTLLWMLKHDYVSVSF